MGHLLHALVGYDARPSGIQVLLFAGTLLSFGGASRLLQRRHPRSAAAMQPTQTV